MIRTTRIALAFALCSAAFAAGGIARADDAMKPAAAMKSDSKMMKADKAMADCKEKAGMMKNKAKMEKAMKACHDMAMKPAKK